MSGSELFLDHHQQQMLIQSLPEGARRRTAFFAALRSRIRGRVSDHELIEILRAAAQAAREDAAA